jgi:phosphinothricin acetyltransferase
MIIRDAVRADMAAVCDIYNALIPTTTVAWSEELQPLETRQAWFDEQQSLGNPVLVAEIGEQVAGFCSYGSFRGAGKWPGYRFTVEHTVHVASTHWNAGAGQALMGALIDRARGEGLHVMVGAVDGDNDGSIRFHERLGFVEVARMPEVGHKFGRWLTLVLMQLTLGEPDQPTEPV